MLWKIGENYIYVFNVCLYYCNTNFKSLRIYRGGLGLTFLKKGTPRIILYIIFYRALFYFQTTSRNVIYIQQIRTNTNYTRNLKYRISAANILLFFLSDADGLLFTVYTFIPHVFTYIIMFVKKKYADYRNSVKNHME